MVGPGYAEGQNFDACGRMFSDRWMIGRAGWAHRLLVDMARAPSDFKLCSGVKVQLLAPFHAGLTWSGHSLKVWIYAFIR
jgi:hypothetical protein